MMKLPAALKHARVVILLGAVVISSCTVTSVVLDRVNNRAWLYDLAKHPTQSKWDQHIDQVLYLVSIGDRQALNAARVILPSVFEDRASYAKSDRLANEMYVVAKLNGVDKLSPQEQIAWIRYYDQHPPEAWRDVRNDYKRQHAASFAMIEEPPEIAAASAPASMMAASLTNATQPTTTPIAVAATRPVDEVIRATTDKLSATTQHVQAATRKADSLTPIAKKLAPPPVATPNSLQRVPANAIQKNSAPAEDKTTPPESTF